MITKYVNYKTKEFKNQAIIKNSNSTSDEFSHVFKLPHVPKHPCKVD